MSGKTDQDQINARISEAPGGLTSTDRAAKTAVVGIYNSHTEAEASIKELQRSGFDMKKLSIVGKDYHTEEHVVGYYNTGDRMKVWGKLGAFWGGLWGLLFGSALVLHPGHRSPDRVRPAGRLDRRRRWKARWWWVVSVRWAPRCTALAFPRTASCSTRRRSSLTSSS